MWRSWNRVLCAGLLVALCGCQVERVPSRAELKQEKQAKKPNVSPDAVREVAPVNGNSDDAAKVLQACGKPESDRTLAIYSKLDHGPVREVRYRGLKVVLLEFVPNKPMQRAQAAGAMSAELPSGAVWTFDDAYMAGEEMMTTERLGVYLPCAAKALRKED